MLKDNRNAPAGVVDDSRRVQIRQKPLLESLNPSSDENAMAQRKAAPLVGIVMGSDSDWEIMKHAVAQLDAFGIANEPRVLSAHRMPDDMFEYAEDAGPRGLRVIIAGAGGAAHLPGMLAAKTIVPVLGVPVPSKYLRGEDSLHSIVQMPKGIPVATFAIGEAGAANAGLFAVAIIAGTDAAVARKLAAFRAKQTAAGRAMRLPPAT
jgi:5-(carboxyamino)imidazole ribonucleotide mutase